MLAVALTGAAGTSYAQTVPSAADPTRVEPVLPNPAESFDQLRKDNQVVAPTTEFTPAPEGSESVHFTLRSLTVQGMHAYTDETIRPLYQGKLGRDTTVADLYAIAARLQQKYFADGYTLTKIIVPPEPVRDGNAQLIAIEGHITQVELDPALPDSDALRDAVAQIRTMRPLNTLVLERLLLVLNDLPDTNVSAILATLKNPTPEENQPGSVRLIIKKNQSDDSRGRIAVNNYGSQFAGPWQALANAHLYDVGMDHSDLSLTVSSTDPYREQHYANVNYTAPLFGASGAKLAVGAVWAQTEPGDNLEALEIEGNTTNFTVNLSYPVIRQRTGTLTTDVTFAAKNTETDLLGSQLYYDRTRSVRAGGNYNFSDAWEGFNALDLHATQGFDILGASNEYSSLSRADGQPDFTKFEFFAGRVQSLPMGFEFYALVSGQYALNPLLSGEEFGFGGDQTGRGYDPSEITGDHGISGTLELRYTAEFQPWEQQLVTQPYAFYDAGKVWNIDSGARDHVSATSAGGGVRFNVNDQWNSNIFAAVPLTKRANNPPDYANATGARFLISISRDF